MSLLNRIRQNARTETKVGSNCTPDGLDTKLISLVPKILGNIPWLVGVSKSMAPNRLSEWMLQSMGASIAGLFLILALYLAADLKPPAQGVWLILPRESKSPECGDGRTEVIHWGHDGQVWINEERVGVARAPAKVAEIMENRAEKVIFLIPSANISVQDVADLAARVNASVDDLHIGMVTNQQMKSLTRTDHGMTWTPIDCMGWPQSAMIKR